MSEIPLTINTPDLEVRVLKICEQSIANCPLRQSLGFAIEGNQTLERFSRFCAMRGMTTSEVPAREFTDFGSNIFSYLQCTQIDGVSACGSLQANRKGAFQNG